MKGKIIIHVLPVLFSLHSFSQAPDWLWAKGLDGTSNAVVNFLSVDTSLNGDVYVTGYFVGSIDFDPGPSVFYLVSSGGFDIFICKLNASGNFMWAKQIGGLGDQVAFSVAADPAGTGDIYISGHFEDTVDFDPGPGVFNLVSQGLYDIFVCKLNSSGNFVWAKQIGGSSYQHCMAMVPTPSCLYITGSFEGITDFDPGPGVFNLLAYDASQFVAKLDTAGNLIWAKPMAGSAVGDYANGLAMALDPSGKYVYTTGSFYGTIDFDPGPNTFNLSSTPLIKHDIFISKLDSSGNFIWTKKMGGPEHDIAYAIAVDHSGNGNVFTSGWFYDTADFDPSPGIFNMISNGSYDIFISNLDSSGNFVWAKQIGGAGTDRANSIAVDNAGDIYMTGYFDGTVDFDPGPGIFNLYALNGGAFFTKLNSTGNFIWARAADGSYGDEGMSLALDGSAKVYATGSYSSYYIYFDATTLTNSSTSSRDIFIAKLDNNPIITQAESVVNGGGIEVFPNLPTSELIVKGSEFGDNGEIEIYNALGEKVFEQHWTSDFGYRRISTVDFLPGIYFLKAKTKSQIFSGRFVKM